MVKNVARTIMDVFIKIKGEKKVYTKKDLQLFNQHSYFENYLVIGTGNDI